MNVGSVGSVPVSLASASTGGAAAVTVLRKSLDIQAQIALQLLAAVAQPVALPAGTTTLGNNIDTYA